MDREELEEHEEHLKFILGKRNHGSWGRWEKSFICRKHCMIPFVSKISISICLKDLEPHHATWIYL